MRETPMNTVKQVLSAAPLTMLCLALLGLFLPSEGRSSLQAQEGRQLVEASDTGYRQLASIGLAAPMQQDGLIAGGEGRGHIPLRVISHMQYLCGGQAKPSGRQLEHPGVGFRCAGVHGRDSKAKQRGKTGQHGVGIAIGQSQQIETGSEKGND